MGQRDLAREERNKKSAMEFFQLLMGDHDYEKAETYMGRYIQHDPEVMGNGMAPLKEYLTTDVKFKDRPKGIEIQLYEPMADGDMVTFQNRKELPEMNMRRIVAHFFKFDEDGKIDEHWTIASAVDLAGCKNEAPLF